MVLPSCVAIWRKARQNSDSKETEVRWPLRVSECLTGRESAIAFMPIEVAHSLGIFGQSLSFLGLGLPMPSGVFISLSAGLGARSRFARVRQVDGFRGHVTQFIWAQSYLRVGQRDQMFRHRQSQAQSPLRAGSCRFYARFWQPWWRCHNRWWVRAL